MYKSNTAGYTIDIKNSIFNNNNGTYNAMYLYYLSHTITLDNITVSDNYNGQAVYLYYLYRAPVYLKNSNFINNYFEDKSGSCIYTFYISELIIDNINVSYNRGYK